MDKKNIIEEYSIYKEIAKLKAFVYLIYNSGELYFKEEKEKALLILKDLSDFRNRKLDFWEVELSIFDRDIQESHYQKIGFYWRNWTLTYENNKLIIDAESRHSRDYAIYGPNDYKVPLNHDNAIHDKWFYEIIDFSNNEIFLDVQLSSKIDDFIKNSLSYENYISGNFNDVVVTID